MSTPESPTLLQAVRRIAREVAAPHADAVDRDARFPHETFAALREARVLSAGVPVAHGGAGLGLKALGQLCQALGQGCGASGMVLAMHLNQLACVARHAAGSAVHERFLREVADGQLLIASMTSEAGTFGDTRASVCAVAPDAADPGRFLLAKEATTASYCAQADALLVTARRDPEAAAGDQSLVLLRRGDYALEQRGAWDTLGMRGTCSPACRLEAGAPRAQVLPVPYADISERTMVPYSHVLWAALWCGIATDAHAKAAAFVRAQARREPGTVPPAALRLAELTTALQAMRHHWQSVAGEFDDLPPADTNPHPLARIGWSLKFNGLKTAAAERAPQVVQGALQIVGIQGYRNDTPYSLGRQLRDALSASLMISNDRIAAQSARMLLVFKDDQE